MSYAVDTLKKEADIVARCLSKWETKEYPEAKKERKKRLLDLNNAIEVLSRKK